MRRGGREEIRNRAIGAATNGALLIEHVLPVRAASWHHSHAKAEEGCRSSVLRKKTISVTYYMRCSLLIQDFNAKAIEKS